MRVSGIIYIMSDWCVKCIMGNSMLCFNDLSDMCFEEFCQ